MRIIVTKGIQLLHFSAISCEKELCTIIYNRNLMFGLI